MGPDEVLVELDTHCIETEARRLFQELMERVLDDAAPRAEDQRAIQLLKEFLEQEDFSRIRAEDPELAGGHNLVVRVHRDHDGQVRWHKLREQ